MSKVKYVLLLIVNTIIVTGFYFYASEELHLVYITPIYMVMAIAAICGYSALCMHHNNEIARAKLEGKELDEDLIYYRKRRIKLFMACFFPFVFAFAIDCFILYVLPVYQNLINSLKR